MARQDFIRKLLPGALEASRRTGLDPRLIIAQAAQETGWGRSAPGNNYFGIKSHGKGGGQSFKTHEYVNGKRVNITDSFRKYDSPSESALGYADFLQNNKRYREMLAAPNLESQVAALGRSGYATDPNYANSVLAIARSIDIDGMPTSPISPSPSSPAGGARAASEIQPPMPIMPDAPEYARPGAGGIPDFVGRAAADDDEPSMIGRMGKALQALGNASPDAPPVRFGQIPDARQFGGLLSKMLNSPTIAQGLLQKRFSHGR